MATRCLVCGRELLKSDGPIGPTCLRKQPGFRKMKHRMPLQVYIKLMQAHDIFNEEDLHESEGNEEASTGVEGQEISSLGPTYTPENTS